MVFELVSILRFIIFKLCTPIKIINLSVNSGRSHFFSFSFVCHLQYESKQTLQKLNKNPFIWEGMNLNAAFHLSLSGFQHHECHCLTFRCCCAQFYLFFSILGALGSSNQCATDKRLRLLDITLIPWDEVTRHYIRSWRYGEAPFTSKYWSLLGITLLFNDGQWRSST